MPAHVHRANCPQCGAAVESTDLVADRHFPFCSRRCKLVDLGKWFEGEYVIETPLEQEDE
jgi:hypothetical protein